MSGDKWVMVAAVAAGVFLIMREATAKSRGRTVQTTDGREFYLEEKDGVMIDQLGGVWA